MFLGLYSGHQLADIAGILSKGPWGNLAMKYLGGDIRVVSRSLPPANVSAIGGYFYKADKLIIESFK